MFMKKGMNLWTTFLRLFIKYLHACNTIFPSSVAKPLLPAPQLYCKDSLASGRFGSTSQNIHAGPEACDAKMWLANRKEVSTTQ